MTMSYLSPWQIRLLSNAKTARGALAGHNQLIFDAAPGEPLISRGTTECASALQLSHLDAPEA